MRRLSILGCTGSIGTSTLEIVDQFPDHFQVVALAAGENLERLAQQVVKYKPLFVSVATEKLASDLQSVFPKLAVGFGNEGLKTAARLPEADFVVAAVVGFAGMESTLEAIRAGKTVGLANKEAMITAGPLMVHALKESGSTLLPIDSEHNALFQCLHGQDHSDLKRILLTCSGGPFRTLPAEGLATVTVAQALKHPNWVMGRKITIDSATLMNKGLEMIEAKFLFNLRPEQIDVVIHPESVIHSMVEWVDGAVTASLGETTMRGPIAHVLHFPRRLPGVLKSIDWGRMAKLTFEDPDSQKFPSLRLARECLTRGGNAPVVMNAANEIAVENFLQERCSFLGIYGTIEHTLNTIPWQELYSVSDVVEFDRRAREIARRYVSEAAACQM